MLIALVPTAHANEILHGIVDQNCEATIRVVVGNAGTQRQMIDAVIDTGFTGFLTLPHSILASLNLQPYRREAGILGDGSTCIFDVYRGIILWDGERRPVDINASETAPLIGMSLLYGYRLQLDVIESGQVTIQALES